MRYFFVGWVLYGDFYLGDGGGLWVVVSGVRSGWLVVGVSVSYLFLIYISFVYFFRYMVKFKFSIGYFERLL